MTDEPPQAGPDGAMAVRPPAYRWLQLAAGILGMVAVANFQYSWTLFVRPLEKERGWTPVQIQDALNLFFILAQTWLVPLEAYLADRFGPRRLLVLGGLLAGLAWVVNSQTESLAVLYAAQVAAGCGSGIVYGISMGMALKWFPDRRGLAAGLTAAAFGAGSAATVLPIKWTIDHHGYQTAFLWFGIGQGLVVALAGSVMRFPRTGEVPAPPYSPVLQSRRDTTPRHMLAMPAFWLLYFMMTMGAIPGLLMIGQLEPIARHFGVAEVPMALFGISLGAALPLALMIDRITGGLTRPVFGYVSDRIGREVAIFCAFVLEGAALFVLIRNPTDPVTFVLMSGLAFFGWGAVFSLFPAVSCDMFGRTYATTNYALLYTAKGSATVLISLINRMHAATGNWELVFGIMIAADFLAAGLALAVLRPLRRRLAERDRLVEHSEDFTGEVLTADAGRAEGIQVPSPIKPS
jgi:OFA family oxalate/formate antiporter-like MFS transporter